MLKKREITRLAKESLISLLDSMCADEAAIAINDLSGDEDDMYAVFDEMKRIAAKACSIKPTGGEA